MNNVLWFKAIKEQMKDRYDHQPYDNQSFWDWVAENFPDTYALCLELTHNTLAIRED